MIAFFYAINIIGILICPINGKSTFYEYVTISKEGHKEYINEVHKTFCNMTLHIHMYICTYTYCNTY